MDKEESPSWEMLWQLRVGKQLGSVEASAGLAWLTIPLLGPCPCNYSLLALGSTLFWATRPFLDAGAEGGVHVLIHLDP